MFARFGVPFIKQDYHEYQTVNKALWIDYQQGSITAEQLQHQRFTPWANRLEVTPKDLNNAFMVEMANICTPLEGAISLLTALKARSKLGIITNGFTHLQETRLQRTGLKDHFDVLVISEQVGIAKPNPGIFDHALSIMGHPNRDQVLMVGDNPDSDILGGINAGFDTCWLNVNNKPTPEGITPRYQISSLKELEHLLLGVACPVHLKNDRIKWLD